MNECLFDIREVAFLMGALIYYAFIVFAIETLLQLETLSQLLLALGIIINTIIGVILIIRQSTLQLEEKQ